MLLDELLDRGDQLFDAFECAAADAFIGDLLEPTFR